MSITIRKILHFFKKLRDIKKTFEKVTHFTPLHPINGIRCIVYMIELCFERNKNTALNMLIGTCLTRTSITIQR